MKQYVVIETFLPGCKTEIYQRFHAKGRMLPEGRSQRSRSGSKW
jgi:hypothetical protein